MDFRNTAGYVPGLYRGELPLTDGHFVHIRNSWVKEHYPNAYNEAIKIYSGRVALLVPVMGIPETVLVRVDWSTELIKIPSDELMF